MKNSIFRKPIKLKGFSQFMDAIHQSHMCYAIPDLKAMGLNGDEIQLALKRAMISCGRAGVPIHLHFHPRYASSEDSFIEVCKLSKLGYQLTLINANPNHRSVALFQVQLMEKSLKH